VLLKCSNGSRPCTPRRETPIERSVELVLRLAAGDADALSGRYLSVEDDLDALVKQFAAEPSAEQADAPVRWNSSVFCGVMKPLR
jgi:hypothetical protein